MDFDIYEIIEEKLKNDFIKREKCYRKKRGKPRKLQRLKERNKNMIKRYTLPLIKA